MSRLPRIPLPALSLLAVLLVAPAARAAWSTNPILNPPIAPGSQIQTAPACIPDGNGGTFVVYQDARSGSFDIYAQHVRSDGTIDPAWPATGVPVCVATNQQTGPQIIADGAGGMIVAWTDFRSNSVWGDIHAQRITASGAVAGGWPVDGAAVGVNPVAETNPTLCTDGAGGAIIVWEYEFSGSDHDLYGAHVTGAGSVLGWGGFYTPIADSRDPAITTDTAGGCYLVFSNNAGVNQTAIQAMRLNAAGGAIYGPGQVYFIPPYVGFAPRIAIDGVGGAYVAWTERGSGDSDVLVSRLGPAAAPQLPFYGNAVAAVRIAGSDQSLTGLAYDGAGGVIVTWTDARYSSSSLQAFAQRIMPNAAIAPGWPVNGVALGYTGIYQLTPVPVPDGTGGALFLWQDFRGGTFGIDLYATRLAANGTRAPNWPDGGTPVVTTSMDQVPFAACTDARRGAIVIAADFHTPPPAPAMYAARIDRYGVLGDAQPAIASIRDVAADQGGAVRLVWNSSYLDADPTFEIGEYWVWRQTPATVAAQAVRDGARWIDADPDGADADASAGASTTTLATTAPGEDGAGAGVANRRFRRAGPDAAQFAWEYLAALPANGAAQYSYLAATASDSVAGHNPRTVFMVEARHAGNGAFWDSAPDSGYSVDNLAPATPAPFTGTYVAGTATLAWGASADADLAGYRLYRGTSVGFVPGPANRIAAPATPGFVDAAGAPYYYKLSAVDAHGNESGFATLLPSGALDAPGEAPPSALAFARPTPNPARGAVALRYDLPRAMRVRLAVFDAAGRRVRSLADALQPAGRYTLRWDLRDADGGATGAGLYFARLEAGGEVLVQRFATLR